MLRRAVKRRPNDWEPGLPAVLQAYRSTPSEATGFTPHRLAFGREMRLPIVVGTPLPEPPRDICTFANNLVEDLDWSYGIAREVSGLQHRRSEGRYDERVVEKLYAPGAYVRVLMHGRHFCAPSKLVPPYSELCKIVEVRGPVRTLRELDSQRIFTANQDAVRLSSLLPLPRAPVDGASPACRGPPQVVRAALPPVLVNNRPPTRRDASPPAFHNAIPQPQIADLQPLRVMPSPSFQIADSQPPFIAHSPSFQSSPQPVFNGPPLRRTTPPPRLMSIQLPDLSNSINSHLINKLPASSSNPQPPSNSSQKRKLNPPRHLEDYYLGAVGVNSCDVSVNSNVSADDITIGYSYPNYEYTVPASPTNFVYSTTKFSFNAIVNVKSDSINVSTEINSSSPCFPSIFNSSPLNLKLDIDLNSSNNFQFTFSNLFVDMQHDDEIAIFQEFGNRLTSLDVARVLLDATSLFEVHIQNISPTFIY